MVITRVIDAPRELVFAAWTDPHHIGQWWGPAGFTTTIYEMDVRPEEGDRVVKEYGAIEGGQQTVERLERYLAGK